MSIPDVDPPRRAIASPRGSSFAAALVAGTAVLIMASAGAALYKWTDANGRVVYSDQPPPANVKVEAIAPPPPPANPNAVKDLANREAEDRQRKIQRAEEDAKAAKAKADTDRRREECSRTRGQIAMLTNEAGLLYRSNEKGEPVYMDDAAKLQQREQLELWVRNNCLNPPG